MGQQDSLKLLNKTKKWMTVKEVSKRLKISTASLCLNKLAKQGEIFRRPKSKGNGFEYKIK